ncbi:MAG: type II toxin-antitoxin system RelE/ParE family toxin [Myxococcales bacterium]|nr:type II toxin-antitoxin system RelE/ParE family toxin [Myxococcales bacterium]
MSRQWREYRTAGGSRPVKEFLNRELSPSEVADVLAAMSEVKRDGLLAARHLRGDIYEVRVGSSTRSFRVLFAAEGRYGQVFLSLSVFAKKTQRTPKREIKLAETRLMDWRRRGGK